jgi:hypothetical protein
MVLAAYLTDEDWYEGTMRDILRTEMRLTTRVGALPDTFDFRTQAFSRAQVDWAPLVFGAAEYCKDGLLPLTEEMGRTEWFSRLRAIAADICTYAPTPSQFGLLPSNNAEVNGNLMQVCARLYPATGDLRFLEMALRLGDAYFLEVLPHSGDLPCHFWDFTAHRAIEPRLGLNDHGSEILGGLTEVYALALRYRPDKAREHEPALRRMVDALLDRCRREDGLWFGSYDTAKREGSGGPPDTWGYILNGVYTCYLLTGEERYREAVEQAMRAICAHTEWNGADAYADAVESGVILLNRLDVPETWQWIDAMTAKMAAMQKLDGIIEGWHGDGNDARTWMLVAMAKTAGCRAQPWRPDLKLGAVRREGKLLVSLRCTEAWTGRLYLDYPRHREHFGVAPNYPRLNEWPEWFTVEDGCRYPVRLLGGRNVPPAPARFLDGGMLRRGLALDLPADGEWLAEIGPGAAPPHGVPQLQLEGPDWIGGRGEAALAVVNLSASTQDVVLSTDWGTLSPERLTLPPGGRSDVTLRGQVQAEGQAQVTARTSGGDSSAGRRVLLVTDADLTDYRDLAGSNTYQGEDYWWLNDGDLALRLEVEPGKAHVLSLYWGCKNDTRTELLALAGETRTLTQSGYLGFRWHDIEIPADKVTSDTLDMKLSKPASGSFGFLGRLKVRVIR